MLGKKPNNVNASAPAAMPVTGFNMYTATARGVVPVDHFINAINALRIGVPNINAQAINVETVLPGATLPGLLVIVTAVPDPATPVNTEFTEVIIPVFWAESSLGDASIQSADGQQWSIPLTAEIALDSVMLTAIRARYPKCSITMPHVISRHIEEEKDMKTAGLCRAILTTIGATAELLGIMINVTLNIGSQATASMQVVPNNTIMEIASNTYVPNEVGITVSKLNVQQASSALTVNRGTADGGPILSAPGFIDIVPLRTVSPGQKGYPAGVLTMVHRQSGTTTNDTDTLGTSVLAAALFLKTGMTAIQRLIQSQVMVHRKYGNLTAATGYYPGDSDANQWTPPEFSPVALTTTEQLNGYLMVGLTSPGAAPYQSGTIPVNSEVVIGTGNGSQNHLPMLAAGISPEGRVGARIVNYAAELLYMQIESALGIQISDTTKRESPVTFMGLTPRGYYIGPNNMPMSIEGIPFSLILEQAQAMNMVQVVTMVMTGHNNGVTAPNDVMAKYVSVLAALVQNSLVVQSYGYRLQLNPRMIQEVAAATTVSVNQLSDMNSLHGMFYRSSPSQLGANGFYQ